MSKESEICDFGVNHILFAQEKNHQPLKPFLVKLAYEDIDGKRYEETCQVDVRRFDGLAWQGESVAWRQMKAIEKIAKSLISPQSG